MITAAAIAIVLGQLSAQQEVEAFLEKHPDAAQLHAAYVQYLHGNSDGSRAERDFLGAVENPAVRTRLNSTEAEIQNNEDLARVKDSFFSFLAQDPEARALAERIYEARDRYGLQSGDSAQGYHYLRTNLDEAADMLADTPGERPGEVQSLIDRLDATPGARDSLRETFKHLAAKPGAKESLSPYWDQVEKNPALKQWESQLEANPALWRKAFTRDVLLSKNADVRAGVAQLQRIVGDDPEIAQAYINHIRELSDKPDARETYLHAWQDRNGYRPAFPRAKRTTASNLQPRSTASHREPRKPDPPSSNMSKPRPPSKPGASRRSISAPTAPSKPTPPRKPASPGSAP